jgi:Fe-Mn family superoxide dismutase
MNAPTPKTVTGGHPFALAPLPYKQEALEPAISKKTVALHYGKHHRKYVETLNELVAGTEFERLSLEEIVKQTHEVAAHAKIFNNAGQALNHDFYWRSLTPRPTAPPEMMRSRLDRDLGGYDAFVEAFTTAATEHFASGWAWLVADGGTLKIITTHDAHTPVAHGMTPLLTIDVWEHAYYLDYQNRREEHVGQVVKKLLDWEFAAENLARE